LRSFQSLFQFGEYAQTALLILADPALGDLEYGNWIEEVELLAAAPERDHKRCLFEQ